MNRQNRTRWQIMFGSVIENFTSLERRQFRARCAELRAAGVKFSIWDTQNNGLSRLIRF